MSTLSPYLDLFKESGNTHKEGHVTLIQDSKIKSSVYRIIGSDILSHYILLNDFSISSRYLYILFRPIPRKYFLIHIDTILDGTQSSLYQITISNATREIKLGETTLDVPYLFNHKATPTPDNSSWSILAIDLQTISLKYFQRNHGVLKSLKICANVLLKGVYVSEKLYHPIVQPDKTHPFPPELSFPVPHGLKFEDLFHYRLLPQLYKPHPQQRSLKITSQLHHKEEPPSPFMSLNKIIGMGVASHQQLIFSKLGSRVFFVCQSMVIAMETSSREQQFYIGHTDKVICIGLSGDELTLASAQLKGGVVRLWDVSNASCLSVLTPSLHSVISLSLSFSGAILCIVGRHSSTGRNQISIWKNSELEIKTLTDVDISVLRIAPFDDSRMVTGGWNNIRFWRVKQSSLKSSPVNLEDYHSCSFTDVQYEASHKIISNRHVYSSTTNGCVLEIEYQTFALKRVWQLFPDISGCVAITSLALHEGFYVTGSADGYVRLWPVDFEHVTMETDHCSPVIAVGVAKDGLQILTATKGSIGILDASNKKYTTLLRTHTHTITGMSLCSQWIVTSSKDNTIRVWNHEDFHQVYEFNNDDGDTPTTVDIHPITNDLGIGYTSGAVRFINLLTGTILSEHKLHPSITSIVFTSDGRRGFSCDSCGSLVLYDTTHTAYPLLTILGNTVSAGVLSISPNNCLVGMIGPLPCIVTLLSVQSLQQVMTFDVSGKRRNEFPLRFCFSNDVIGHVIILTNQNRLQKYSITNGQFVSEFVPGHEMGVSLVTVTNKGSLITAGVKGDIKVWNDYHKPTDHQSFIGHNGSTVTHLLSSNDQLLTSAGSIMCSWNIQTNTFSNGTPPPTNITLRPLPLDSGWPRKKLPVPATPLMPQKEVELLKATPNLNTPSEMSDEIIINHTPQGGVELTLTTPTRTPATTVRPYKATRHYSHNPPSFSKPTKLFLVPPTQSSALLHRVIGYNESGQNTLHWLPKQGTILYASGSIIVKEDIQKLSQQLLIGHQTEVATFAVSNDGWSLASSSYAHDKWKSEIRLWDLDTCQCDKILHYHEVGVNCLAYSLDGRYLLSAGDDKLLAVYSIHQSTLLFSTQLSHVIHDLQWDPSTAYEFATVNVEGINFWMYDETSSDLQVHKPTMPSNITECTALCYTSHHYLYVGSLEGIITVWNTRDNSCNFLWKTGCSEIGSMYCEANNQLVVGGAEGVVQLWFIDPSVNKPAPVLQCSFDLVGGVYSMSFDSKLNMGVVAAGKCVYFIDWTTKHVNNLSYGHHGNIIGLSYSSDGRVLASTDESGVTVLWSTKDWTPLQNYTTKGMVCTAVLLVDHTHQLLCVCGYSDGTMVTFNVANGRVIKRYRPHKSAITKLVSSKKVSTILSGSDNGVVMATDTLYGSTHYTILSHQGSYISDLDGKIFSVGLPGVVSVHEELWLVSSNDQRVSIWCDNTLFDWLTFPSDKDNNKECPSLARFCPTEPDHVIYTGYGLECAVLLYSLTQKKIIRKLSLNYWPTSLSISSNGQLIAIGSKEQVLTLMDTEGTFQESSTHSHALTTLEFSPNGQQLISTSLNNIHIWQVQ